MIGMCWIGISRCWGRPFWRLWIRSIRRFFRCLCISVRTQFILKREWEGWGLRLWWLATYCRPSFCPILKVFRRSFCKAEHRTNLTQIWYYFWFCWSQFGCINAYGQNVTLSLTLNQLLSSSLSVVPGYN